MMIAILTPSVAEALTPNKPNQSNTNEVNKYSYDINSHWVMLIFYFTDPCRVSMKTDASKGSLLLFRRNAAHLNYGFAEALSNDTNITKIVNLVSSCGRVSYKYK